jgi:hypothetical protein
MFTRNTVVDNREAILVYLNEWFDPISDKPIMKIVFKDNGEERYVYNLEITK